MTSRLNFLCLSADQKGSQRCQQVANDFQYSFLAIADASPLIELQTKYDQIQMTLINAISFKNNEEIAGHVQIVRQLFRDSFICVIADKKLPQEVAVFIKKSGANMVLLENEFFETSRLEFVASQVIRASYVPVKLNEFPKDSVLDFTLFHLLPLNQKLLPILPKGTPLTEGRLKKFEAIGEVFVKREEVDKYRHYVETHPEIAGQGLQSRCRAQYLSYCNSHTQLIFLLLDQSEGGSFKEGKWLYERCEIQARDLLTSLSAVGEAWDVVNNSSLGEFGSVERSPTISAYAGLFSLLATVGEPVDVMVAGLLSDVGMLDLHPQITKKLRDSQNIENLTKEEFDEYKKHPIISIHRCAGRKLTLKDSIKEMIMCTHERADGKGFPQGRDATKIPVESLLIQFSEIIDRTAMIKMGQPRVSVKEVRRQLVDSESAKGKNFPFSLMAKLKPVI